MRKRLIITFIVFVGLYHIKSDMGIDLLDSFSLGIYNNSYFQLHPVSSKAFANVIEENIKNNVITIDFDKEKGRVNQNIFGHNFLGHKAGWKPYNKYSDYGAGLWDGKWDHSIVSEPLKLAKDIGIKTARFPGGCGTHGYDWKKAVGKKRKAYAFGIDEFLKFTQTISAEPILTVSYFTGDEHDAADLVEYLNGSDDGSNPNGGVDWALERVKNGHEEPYHVKYFEIGNEVYHGHKDYSAPSPEEYASNYLKYYGAMRSIDASIEIGVNLNNQAWNEIVLSVIKSKVNFGILHQYPRPWGRALEEMDAEYIFKTSLAIPITRYAVEIQDTVAQLRKYSGYDIPLAITEYNGGFVQEGGVPVPYRHTLGNALVNAELLQLYLKPENNILMANHWLFINAYWGMISNGFYGKYEDLNRPYLKRPNYYVFQMFKEHFGEILLRTDVESDSYDFATYPSFYKTQMDILKKGTVEGKNLLKGNWKKKDFSGVIALEEKSVLSLEFKSSEKVNYYHSTKSALVWPKTYYRLSGYIKTEHLSDLEKNGVCLEIQDSRGWIRTHSALATEKIKGTTDWQYVETIYKTLPDAHFVNIFARRVGEDGPLNGKASFRDVRLEKFIPDIDTRIPYLSVTASKNNDGNKVY